MTERKREERRRTNRKYKYKRNKEIKGPTRRFSYCFGLPYIQQSYFIYKQIINNCEIISNSRWLYNILFLFIFSYHTFTVDMPPNMSRWKLISNIKPFTYQAIGQTTRWTCHTMQFSRSRIERHVTPCQAENIFYPIKSLYIWSWTIHEKQGWIILNYS